MLFRKPKAAKEVSVDELFQRAYNLMLVADVPKLIGVSGKFDDEVDDHLARFASVVRKYHHGHPACKPIIDNPALPGQPLEAKYRYQRLTSRGKDFILSRYVMGPIQAEQLAYYEDYDEYPDLPAAAYISTNHEFVPNDQIVVLRPRKSEFDAQDRRQLHDTMLQEQDFQQALRNQGARQT